MTERKVQKWDCGCLSTRARLWPLPKLDIHQFLLAARAALSLLLPQLQLTTCRLFKRTVLRGTRYAVSATAVAQLITYGKTVNSEE